MMRLNNKLYSENYHDGDLPLLPPPLPPIYAEKGVRRETFV